MFRSTGAAIPSVACCPIYDAERTTFDIVKSSIIVAIAVLLGMPFFTVFGSLSDKIGRLKIMMLGNLIAALTYIPIYKWMMSSSPDPKNPNMVVLTLLVFIQVIYVTMVYGPIAAFLIEAFPAKIRYTSFSLPYHLGNGEFGGATPLIATAIVAATGNIYAGLFWPIAIALMTFIVGTLYVKETRHVKIWDEVGGEAVTIPPPEPSTKPLPRPAT